MLFNSIEFLLFLPIVFVLYWFVFNKKLKTQNFIILLSSYIFYGWWDWRFLSLILISTIVDYFVGLEIYHSTNLRRRRIFLWISILFNLGLLGFFKYYNFFIDSWIEVLGNLGYEVMNTWTLNIILPVGISFYTFQTMSYSIDIYRRQLAPTRDFISFASFVSFFPQLVAGPIERASNLLPQMLTSRRFDYEKGLQGLFLILNGFFRKIVLGDGFAVYVNNTWDNIETSSGLSLIIGSFFFGLQIYLDFSGYTNIARGIAKLLGFELMVNFDRPYLAKNINEFWSRWHISLSTWFRDYLYVPLGGNRVSQIRWAINIGIVFLLSGLWHGANWTFIVWALIHVFMYFVDKFTPKLSSLVTTQLAVLFAWIFFRSKTVEEAFLYLRSIVENDFFISFSNLLQGIGATAMVILLFHVFLLFLLYKTEERFQIFSTKYQTLVLSIMFTYTCLFFEKNGGQFIYFQF
ncbi:MBOAT family O-acyltransferase [Arenibacter troitsensis]|uniref:D-alanyl-lipoteichoic acid acyltransferase DltB, MBOAT superfamily n=1 Tax=Arenibacter troitsensis TaxID=188872 RepID=A0A1X7IZ18_9FLAO|nr:MBOAT family O-acyltransferase [Arenibacter troitsensis]SMG20149.1 D-alanyl-lipoteichoic acid acyltransferase DltB, MBOAT superfamily [Arenibacter troitsensis]